MCKKILIIVLLFFMFQFLYSQTDSRYDSGLNLPFNEKAGEVNPQTGNLTLSFTDLTLPGRGGFNFQFGRIRALNQSNVYHMYKDPVDGANRLGPAPAETNNHLGSGWISTVPFISEDYSSGDMILNLFYGGEVYEIDQTGVKIYNPARSNIQGYDLLDKRIYEDSSIGYGDFTDLDLMISRYGIFDREGDRSDYQLILKNNTKLWFRPDGKLMVKKDPSGLNTIWYFYDVSGRLSLVVDSIGREIRFAYDSRGNLARLSWEVTLAGETETREVFYEYTSALSLEEIDILKDDVIDFREPYLLTRVTNPGGLVTAFSYKAGTADFTYNSDLSHSRNVYLLLTEIKELFRENPVTGEESFLRRRVFEYAVPEKGMFTHWFYSGYMEYYRISRSYYENRFREIKNDTLYNYFENGEAGNFNRYSTVITRGKIKNRYTYTISDKHANDHVLDNVVTETEDGFLELTDFVYNSDRTKSMEEVFRKGTFVYGEYFLYDKKGQLRRFEDREGLVTLKEYDDTFGVPIKTSQLLSVDGKKKTYESEVIIDNLGRVKKEILHRDTGPLVLLEMEYDAYGNVIRKTDSLGQTVYTVYDSQYNAFPVKKYQDVTIPSWSTGGDVHANWRREPDGTSLIRMRSWQVFNSDGSLWIDMDNEGYAEEYFYDALGTVIAIRQPDENDLNSFAGPLVISGGTPLGTDFDDLRETSFYNAFLASREDNPGETVEVNYYQERARTFRDIDRASNTRKITEIIKDGLGNTLEEITYGPGGTVEGVKKMTYDSFGRMISLTDPDAGEESKQVRVNGVSVSRHDKTWIIGYDDLGRQKFILYPEAVPGQTDIKRITYNDLENSVTVTDPRGGRIYERKNWSGNTLELINYGDLDTPEEDVQITAFEYDLLGRKLMFKDPRGIITRYRYDERDLMTTQDYGSTGTDSMVYDDAGRLIEKCDRKGQYLVLSYDELGRNTAVTHFKSLEDYRNNQPEEQVETIYDNRGNAVRISNSILLEHYEYDWGNRVKILEREIKNSRFKEQIATVWEGNTDSQVFRYSYMYNDMGLITSMVYPDGAVHHFTYDQALARLSSINEQDQNGVNSPFITHLDYNKSGVITSMDSANGVTQEWSFDNRKRISKLTLRQGTEVIDSLDFTLSSTGDILKINDHTYSYDGFYRITGAKTKLPGAVDRLELVRRHFGAFNFAPLPLVSYNPEADLNGDNRINGEDHHIALAQNRAALYDNETFTYDKNGNRLKLVQNGDIYSYEYGERNRLLKIYKTQKGEKSPALFSEFTYDQNGNTTSRKVYPSGEYTTYTYDTLNRLTSITEGDKISSFFYDNSGNRLIKTEDERMSLYLRHGQSAVGMDLEINTDQSEIRGKINRYVLSGELIAGRVSRIINHDGDEETVKSWYHLDHLNSTKWVTQESGAIEVFYEYRAFGEQLKRLNGEGNPVEDLAKYSYNGKELDQSDLYYFNARYYDPASGRFINVDPIQDGSNWYIYCDNNPLNMKDPTGLTGEEGKDGNDGGDTADNDGLTAPVPTEPPKSSSFDFTFKPFKGKISLSYENDWNKSMINESKISSEFALFNSSLYVTASSGYDLKPKVEMKYPLGSGGAFNATVQYNANNQEFTNLSVGFSEKNKLNIGLSYKPTTKPSLTFSFGYGSTPNLFDKINSARNDINSANDAVRNISSFSPQNLIPAGQAVAKAYNSFSALMKPNPTRWGVNFSATYGYQNMPGFNGVSSMEYKGFSFKGSFYYSF